MLNKIYSFLFKIINIIDNEGRVNIRKILFFLILVALIVIVPYWYCLSENGISKDPSYWGQFGDYIGGLLNPIFTLINIIILIHLTFIVSNKEDKRTFDEIKYRTYKELMQQFYKERLEKEVYFSNELSEGAKRLDGFIELHNLEFLSLFLGEEKNIIAKLIGEFQATLNQMHMEIDTKRNSGNIADELLMKTLMNLFATQKLNLIEFFQASLYQHDTSKFQNINNKLLINGARRQAEEQISSGR